LIGFAFPFLWSWKKAAPKLGSSTSFPSISSGSCDWSQEESVKDGFNSLCLSSKTGRRGPEGVDAAGALSDVNPDIDNLGRGDKSVRYLILRLVMGVMGGEEIGLLLCDPLQVLRF